MSRDLLISVRSDKVAVGAMLKRLKNAILMASEDPKPTVLSTALSSSSVVGLRWSALSSLVMRSRREVRSP